MKRALVVGATGATGKLVLEKLLLSDEFDKIYTLSRRDVFPQNSKLNSFIVNFENLDSFHFPEGIEIDQLYFCYGTTLKKAGGKEAFKKIEGEFSQKILKLATRSKVHRVLLISSLGANENSAVLYNQIKGKIETFATELRFPELVIFRPSLLLTEREELRVGELIGQKMLKPFAHLFQSTWPKYAPISTEKLSDQLMKWGRKPSLPQSPMILENTDLLQK
jgi:uncharacterized protein YbjT (DUF2867 family)